MDFHNFFTVYVSKVKESTADIPAELPCFESIQFINHFDIALPYRKSITGGRAQFSTNLGVN